MQLDAATAIRDKFRSSRPEAITLDERDVDELQETVDQLHREVVKLRESRRRLAMSADADRRRIARELHGGLQQHLVALAMTLQLARSALDSDDSAKAASMLDELRAIIQEAVAEAARLADEIHPQLEAGGLAVALRSAAASAGVRVSVEADVPDAAPEVAAAVYRCCREVFEDAGAGAQATVTIRIEGRALTFEVVADASSSDAWLDRLRDRVEALDGHVTIERTPGRGSHVAGSLPL